MGNFTRNLKYDIKNGLIGYWKLDEMTGLTTFDSTSNHNNLSLVNTPLWVAGRKGRGAVSTNTPGNTISVLQMNTSISISYNWTISVWVLFPLVTFNSNYRTLVRCQTGGTNHAVLVYPSNLLGMYDNDTGGGFRSTGFNVTSISSGWHLLTATCNSSTNTTFYLDKTLIGTSDKGSAGDFKFWVGANKIFRLAKPSCGRLVDAARQFCATGEPVKLEGKGIRS